MQGTAAVALGAGDARPVAGRPRRTGGPRRLCSPRRRAPDLRSRCLPKSNGGASPPQRTERSVPCAASYSLVPRADCREPTAAHRSREPRAEGREPRAAGGEPRAAGREPRAARREPNAESREPHAASRTPRAESREPRAESREPRAESRMPRAESRTPRAASRTPRAASRTPNAASRAPRTAGTIDVSATATCWSSGGSSNTASLRCRRFANAADRLHDAPRWIGHLAPRNSSDLAS